MTAAKCTLKTKQSFKEYTNHTKLKFWNKLEVQALGLLVSIS